MPKRASCPPRRRSPGRRCAGPSGGPKAAACRRHAREARCGRGGGGGRKGRVSPWLLLLAFFAEDIFAAILDALALVRLWLSPAADFRRGLGHPLLFVSRELLPRPVGVRHLRLLGPAVMSGE